MAHLERRCHPVIHETWWARPHSWLRQIQPLLVSELGEPTSLCFSSRCASPGWPLRTAALSPKKGPSSPWRLLCTATKWTNASLASSPTFPCSWQNPFFSITFKHRPRWQSLLAHYGQSVIQNHRSSALKDAMHPIMAELLAWLQQAFLQQGLWKKQSIFGPCPSCGFLPMLKLLLCWHPTFQALAPPARSSLNKPPQKKALLLGGWCVRGVPTIQI